MEIQDQMLVNRTESLSTYFKLQEIEFSGNFSVVTWICKILNWLACENSPEMEQCEWLSQNMNLKQSQDCRSDMFELANQTKCSTKIE